MWTVLGSLVITVIGYLLCLGGAAVLLLSARWALISLFETLPPAGPSRIARQLLAGPIVGLLGNERRARRGDRHSLYVLAAIEFVLAGLLSLVFQGPWPAGILTALLLIAGYLWLDPA